MKVILFGATGMVGQGVLRECLRDPRVASVLAVVRAPTGRSDPKLRELVWPDFLDFSGAADEFAGADACFFCLGVSSVRMSEADYTRVTHDVTMAAARVLAEVSPELTFVYVSGQGTDGTEQSRTMWARVKGRTENELIALLPNAYAFRPGFIQPLHGIRSKTGLYRVLYALIGPLAPVLRRAFPRAVTTTEQIGLAMLDVAERGYPRRVLENRDLTTFGDRPGDTRG
ncbi:NAD-dependent epimerase/dehydratase family protein [Plantactinospora endophytica]|uniref:Epimerase n=1 Tax=Plantactinospora endophytica TaxID=673535 RepID=A0ABQ4E3Y5_9ACTN|nr:NAD-dependent epimerase/dehydratase family protein [Plantactinospora endophytica]GIG89405.1 epimerase [Plantactinospora endophytica]